MAQRFKHPAEFYLDEKDLIKQLFLAGEIRQIERRRRCYEVLRIRAQEIAEDGNTRKADTAEKYLDVFYNLQLHAGEALARAAGVFEPNLDLSNISKIANYVDLKVDDGQ